MFEARADTARLSVRAGLEELVQRARDSAAFAAYLEVREWVFDMIERTDEADRASDYWQEEIGGFEYALDPSPLVVSRLREHCYHLTGVRSYEYRRHHAHQQEAFARKLAALRAIDRVGLFVPESRELGGFGHTIDGVLVNIDTLKFYECLIALERAGALDRLRDRSSRPTVVEIGAGWGGLAYQMKTLFPRVRYVVVDLPQTILFSGTYVKTMFPDGTIVFSDELDGAEDIDFAFLPPFAFGRLRSTEIDLALNTVSFQEMTTSQVRGYAGKLHELRCPLVYSLNRDRSRHNKELTGVSDVLGEYFELNDVPVLDVPYTSLSLKRKAPKAASKRATEAAGWRARAGLTSRTRSEASETQALSAGDRESAFDYRHLVGRRRG